MVSVRPLSSVMKQVPVNLVPGIMDLGLEAFFSLLAFAAVLIHSSY